MVVCQYFLRGACKFGTNCRNEHPSGGLRTSTSFGGLSKSALGPASNAFSKGQVPPNNQSTVEKIITNIKNEVFLWEKSKMWPFSCFSYQKESPCVAGLVDQSPEELRLEAYIAKENETTNECLNNIKQLEMKFMTRRAELKSITPANWEQVLQNSSGSSSSGPFQSQGTKSSLFSSTSLLFANQATQAANPFAPSSTISKQSLFGNTPAQSLFNGASSFAAKQDSPFASGQSAVFGSSNQQPFPSNTAPSSSLFGSSATSQPGLFQQKQTEQPFGSVSIPTQGSLNNGLFSHKTLTNAGLPSQQQSNGAHFAAQSVFGSSSQQPSSLFGQSLTKQPLASAGGESAGLNTMQETANPFAQALKQEIQPDHGAVEEVPSHLKLTEKDIEAFKADRFVFGQIPECPPPQELC